MIHMSDEEQIQMLKKWWRKYGTYILTGVFIFLVGNYSWRYYQQYQIRQASLASVAYSQMLDFVSQKKIDTAELYAKSLQKNYRRTPYASLASLILAKEAIDNGKFNIAEEKLRWIISHGGQNALRQLARIELARIMVADKRFDAALALLRHIKDKSFTGAVSEARGDALAMSGKKEDAILAYKNALKFNRENGLDSPLLKVKAEQFGIQ